MCSALNDLRFNGRARGVDVVSEINWKVLLITPLVMKQLGIQITTHHKCYENCLANSAPVGQTSSF